MCVRMSVCVCVYVSNRQHRDTKESQKELEKRIKGCMKERTEKEHLRREDRKGVGGELKKDGGAERVMKERWK